MPRLPAVLLTALAGTAHAPWGGMDQNLLDCEYDLPQHACPTCEGAPLGLAGGMPDAVVALTPRCIEAEGGCCEHDGASVRTDGAEPIVGLLVIRSPVSSARSPSRHRRRSSPASASGLPGPVFSSLVH